MAVEPAQTIEIFYSYAHEDEALRDQLEKHLSVLKRQGLISNWHDRLINAGTDWEPEIDTHLNTAHIILLLVSADFMFSEYCYSIEMERALERHNAGEARVIPIILRSVVWQNGPFGKLQVLPTGGKPIVSWPDRDEAFADVVRGIRKVIESLPTVPSPKNALFNSMNKPDLVQVNAVQNPWSSLGSMGVLIEMYSHAQQWEHAEQVARSIEDSLQRALAQRMLVNELGKAHQWVRAESVARSIEVRSERVDAYCGLVGELSNAKEWVRAEAVVHTIEDGPYRFKAIEQLSDALIRAGESGRAVALMQSLRWYQTSPPPQQYQPIPTPLPSPSLPQGYGGAQSFNERVATTNIPQPQGTGQQRRAFSRLPLLAIVLAIGILLAIVIVAVKGLAFLQTPAFYIVSSIIILVVVIVGIFAFIRGRN